MKLIAIKSKAKSLIEKKIYKIPCLANRISSVFTAEAARPGRSSAWRLRQVPAGGLKRDTNRDLTWLWTQNFICSQLETGSQEKKKFKIVEHPVRVRPIQPDRLARQYVTSFTLFIIQKLIDNFFYFPLFKLILTWLSYGPVSTLGYS